MLQDSYLRWADVDLETVSDTKAYLAQLVTRQSLNFLRAQSRRREDYIGPWLPEPLLLEQKDASADVVLAESVSMAMLVVLETLSPEERAVFVLHEVFGFNHEEISSTICKSVSATRQLAHRARQHVQARRKRFEPVDQDRSLEITAKFFTAASTGDVDGLLEMLAPNVVWTADSDGKATAARKPVMGPDKIAKLLVGMARITAETGRVEPAMYNNAPALKLYLGERFEGLITVEITEGLISHFYVMRNPDKLTAVDIPRKISRDV